MRISIRFTLFGLFGSLAAVSIGQGVVALHSLSAISAATHSISEDTIPSVLALGQLNSDYGDLRVEHLGYMLASPEKQQKILSEIAQTHSQIDKDLKGSQSTLSNDAERAIYQKYIEADAAYRQVWEQAKSLKDNGKDSEAITLLLGDGKTLYDKAGEVIQQEVDQNVADNTQNLETTNSAVQFSILSVFTALGLAIIIGASAILLTLLRVIRPLSRMTAYMTLLSTGDTTKTVPESNRRDEIGEMAGAVETFRQAAIENRRLEADAEVSRQRAEQDRLAVQQQAEADAAERLQLATSGLAAGLKRLASGDLAFQLNEEFSADFEALRHDFNSSIQQLGATLSAISNATVTIDSGTQEISHGASDLSRRTEQQAASLEETAAALDQITANVGSSSKRAEEARQVANQANVNAMKSGEVVARAVDAMTRIEQSSNQISNIIGVIDEIAFQTNLLALNAGVEAARAGDAGKGFAVVAQEVRELAQRSAQAAKEIKALIRSSSAEVGNGVKLVSETGAVLKTIEAQVLTINHHMEEIATSAREQSVGLSEVNTAVNQMDQVTQKNAAMVEETTAASTSLANEAANLARLIARFKLDAGPSSTLPAVVTGQQTASPARALRQRLSRAFGVKTATATAAKEWSEF
ncbi:chemotaxis protein [Rhizobium sp. AC27/96]|uniref:HAMP domain-containing methyl-accepting chemotaxis protein n=1 Tax=Rhizobium sp. AC27/96 TaxID=1841653 RepID=UPI000828FCA0|nr:methyl-accepting chemotaxis protein [Rhizobium sp. AC27/96]OCJ06922.1 chemotaxis protein [Rhizobium sp. AC27/96]